MLVADIAHPYQDGFDVEAYAAGGAKWLIIKATEGADYRNPMMAEWRERAHVAGMYVGLYHFLRSNSTESEVGNFLSHTGGIGPGEVPLCDWEDTADGAQCLAWCGVIEAKTGRRPVIYSYGPWLASHETSSLTRFPLWIAAYGSNDGAEHGSPNTDRWTPFEDGPGAYPHEGRTIGWQFTSRGSHVVPGFSGDDLDVSRVTLTLDQLDQLCGGGVPKPPGRRWPFVAVMEG